MVWLPRILVHVLASSKLVWDFTAQTGGPLSIQYSNAGLNAPFINNRPNVNRPVETYGKVKTGATWFDTTKFSTPANGAFGNVGRNILVGPDLVNLDFSLFRKFRITERTSNCVPSGSMARIHRTSTTRAALWEARRSVW